MMDSVDGFRYVTQPSDPWPLSVRDEELSQTASVYHAVIRIAITKRG